MFFHNLKQDQMFPADRVRKICRRSTSSDVAVLDTGEEIEIYRSTADELARSGTTIPAAPGFFVLHKFGDDGSSEPGHLKAPIIAWSISVTEGVVPITVDGANDGMSTILDILDPTGAVTRQGDRGWLSLADWLREDDQ